MRIILALGHLLGLALTNEVIDNFSDFKACEYTYHSDEHAIHTLKSGNHSCKYTITDNTGPIHLKLHGLVQSEKCLSGDRAYVIADGRPYGPFCLKQKRRRRDLLSDDWHSMFNDLMSKFGGGNCGEGGAFQLPMPSRIEDEPQKFELKSAVAAEEEDVEPTLLTTTEEEEDFEPTVTTEEEGDTIWPTMMTVYQTVPTVEGME